MISDHTADEAYVWIWLPGAVNPVVAGRLWRDEPRYLFNYGQSYLARPDAIAIHERELPLREGLIEPVRNLLIAGCIRDAAPDSWGRRVILNRKFGLKGRDVDTDRLDEISYLLGSGSDRIGALDFQQSSRQYVARTGSDASLEELQDAAARIEAGIPLSVELDEALHHGTAIGGARPKALITSEQRKYVAKFSSSTDSTNQVKAEFATMRLAARLGLDVAPVRLMQIAGKDVLLVERFDRHRTEEGWTRREILSALTLLELDEMQARYSGYDLLAEMVRHKFAAPRRTLRELFARMTYNILCGNTDDHARNHAAIWDGRELTLSPAYDLCPQIRAGGQASQAMRIIGDANASTLKLCLEAASIFGLSTTDAEDMIIAQIAVIRSNLAPVLIEAGLSVTERNLLTQRSFLTPYIFQGAPQRIAALMS